MGNGIKFAEQAYGLLELARTVANRHDCTYTEGLNVVIASHHEDEEAVLAHAALYFSAMAQEKGKRMGPSLAYQQSSFIDALKYGNGAINNRLHTNSDALNKAMRDMVDNQKLAADAQLNLSPPVMMPPISDPTIKERDSFMKKLMDSIK